MKKFLCFFIIFLLCGNCYAANYVRGYYRSNGTYVEPHYRSKANATRYDNYLTRGNYNPYTGKTGTQNPYKTYRNYNRGYSTYRY